MGSRGIQPKPKQPIGECKPPEKPNWLTGEASKRWDVVVPQLLEMKTVQESDANVLARYCVAWEHWQDCQVVLATEGLTYELEMKGQGIIVKERPEAKLSRDLENIMFKIESAFGMNANSRKKLATEQPQEKKKSALERLTALTLTG